MRAALWGDVDRLGCRRLIGRIRALPPDSATMRALRDSAAAEPAKTSDMKKMFGDVATYTPLKAE